MSDVTLPILPCPDCRLRGIAGTRRIGHRRSECGTCNNFAQAVRRLAYKRFKEKYAAEYEQMRLEVELGLYPRVIEDFAARYPTEADYERERAEREERKRQRLEEARQHSARFPPSHPLAPGIPHP